MPSFEPLDPAWETKVSDSFGRQAFMREIGALLTTSVPGHVEIELPYREALTQQHGFFHGGVTTAIADSAGGYAAFSLFPPGSSVLTVEFKINLLAPAQGEKLRAIGQVLRPGRTLTVCELKVLAILDGRETLCAAGQQTLICLAGKADA
jgi:uncharacterized protein (TIGR00369 family)